MTPYRQWLLINLYQVDIQNVIFHLAKPPQLWRRLNPLSGVPRVANMLLFCLFCCCLVPIPPPTGISPSTWSLRFHSLWVLKTIDGEARRTPINELAGGASTESDLVQGPCWFWMFAGDNRRWVQKTWIDWNRVIVIVIGAIINNANTSHKPELLHFINCTNRRVIKQKLLFGISSTGRSFLAIVVQTSIYLKQII